MSEAYQPPYTLDSKIVALVADISAAIRRLTAFQEKPLSVRLRRINRIKTIQGSLAIEGNTLSGEQITAILDGKQILAPPKDVLEARNALAVYDKLFDFNPYLQKDLLKAHKLLMSGLLDFPGAFRTGSAGIMKGKDVVHIAPPAENVPALVKDLLIWLKTTKEHPLLSCSVFHYEFEFIHPFADGNGRLGRFWQTLILSKWEPLLAYIPVETLIYQNQKAYYAAINQSNRQANSSAFIEFMLSIIKQAVDDTVKTSVKIIDLIGANTLITIPELAEIIGVTERSIERNLQVLQRDGLLRRIGSARGGRWEVL